MSAKHTPGPWIVAGSDVMTPAHGLVATVFDGTRLPETDLEIAEVNARLIAATTDLLEAGKLLAAEVSDILEECSDDARASALRAWNNALAKATGAA